MHECLVLDDDQSPLGPSLGIRYTHELPPLLPWSWWAWHNAAIHLNASCSHMCSIHA